jgi:hypothetical protein
MQKARQFLVFAAVSLVVIAFGAALSGGGTGF